MSDVRGADAPRRSGALEPVKIVMLTIGVAIAYGVLHDQVTARVCLEYFTVAHPDVAGHEPTIIALYWGVVATWWVGLPFGIGLAVAARAGSRPRLDARRLVRPVVRTMSFVMAAAMMAGVIGFLLGSTGRVHVLGRFAEEIPSEHHDAFLFDAWAHTVSYLGGAIGGLVVMVRTWRSRGRMQQRREAKRLARMEPARTAALLAERVAPPP